MSEQRTAIAVPRLTSATGEYYIVTRDRDERRGWRDGCIVWWRPKRAGYTHDLNEAGIYTEADRQSIDPGGKHLMFVPKEIVDAHCHSPRLAWWSDECRDPICEALKAAAEAQECYDREQADRQRLIGIARDRLALFRDCSTEAIILDVMHCALMLPWDECAFEARRAQLDIEAFKADRQHKTAQKLARAELDRLNALPDLDPDRIRIWRRYLKLSKHEDACWHRKEELWANRDALWAERKEADRKRAERKERA